MPANASDWRIALLGFCLSFPVYIATLAPTVTGEDSGELITAAHSLGIAHPPGYPLWAILGKVFTVAVPVGNVAYRVNLLSAFLAACATAVLALVIRRFIRLNGQDAGGTALTAALVFAFSREFWAQSVIAEVYSLNILFLATVLLLVFRWDDERRPRDLYFLSFVYGLSLTNHSTMAPLGLVLAAYILWRTPWLLSRPLLLVNLFGTVLVGFSIFLYLPIRSLADPAMDWGNPETLQATLAHILRRQYAGIEGVRPRVLAEQMLLAGHFLKDLVMQFTPVLFPLILLGAIRHFRLERRSFILAAILFLASSAGIIWLFNYPPVREDLVIKRTFYLPAYALAAIWLGLGLHRARAALAGTPFGSRLGGRSLTSKLTGCLAGALVVALPLLWFHGENDRSDYYFADDYGRNLLRTLEQDAIIVPSSDHATFTLIYLTEVEGLRSDILIADRYGSIEDAFLERLFRTDRAITSAPPKEADRLEKIRYLVEHCRRPVYFTVKEALQSPRFELVTTGMLFEARPTGETPDEVQLGEVWKRHEWHPRTFEERCRDYTADMILADYHYARGRHEILFRRNAEGLEAFRRAASHAWGVKEVLNNLGGHLAENGLAAEAVPYLLAAWEVEPGYLVAGRNLAVAHQRAGRYAEGLRWFLRALEINPRDGVMLLAAARGARACGKVADAIGYYFRLEGLEPKDPALYEEIKAFLQSVDWRPELLATYDEKVKTLDEERKKAEEETVKALEEGQELPALSGVPKPALPAIPDIAGEVERFNEGILQDEE